MSFAKNLTMECQKFAETEMNQHFGKTLATHFHVIIFGSKTQYNFIYIVDFVISHAHPANFTISYV